MTQERLALGVKGEDLACEALVERGCAVVTRRYSTEHGEIDIVAREGSTLVVCEVKTRRGLNYGSPAESITYRKLATLRRFAGRWLQAHDLRPAEIRIDVISILFDNNTPPRVDHVRGAV